MQRLKKAWAEKYKDLMVKGHERITIMIIPHGEKHIFNLQLSKITIVFAILVIAAVFTASVLSYQLQENIRVEVDTLQDTNRSVYHEREQYIQKFIEMTDKQEKFKEAVMALYQMADVKNADLFSNEDDLYSRATAQMKKESRVFLQQYREWQKKKEDGKSTFDIIQSRFLEKEEIELTDNFEFHPEVVAYRRLHLDLVGTINAVKVLRNFLVQREHVQENLPYSWPIQGGHFTSFYGLRVSPTGKTGEFHTGVDLAKARGSLIYAAADGVVKSAGFAGGYGLRVRIEHRFGYETIYAHLGSKMVSKGQQVKKGQPIGRVGTTGRTTGPHLHYEVRISGKTVNPMRFLSAS